MKYSKVKDIIEIKDMVEKIDGKDFDSCKELYDYLQYLHSLISNQECAINSAVHQLKDYVKSN